MNLKLDKITINDLQARAHTDETVVAEYAESWLEGEKFPDVTVFHDGTNYFLADGFHRYFGALKAGLKDINADVRKGSRDEALWFAIGANRTHGLKRTNADKRKAVEIALRQKPEMADNAIAKHIGVSQPLVSEVRGQLQVLEVDSLKTPTKRVGLDGKERKSPIPPPSKKSSISIPKPSESKAKIPQRTAPAVFVPPSVCDKIGRSIPDVLIPLWERRYEIEERITVLTNVCSWLKKIDSNDALFVSAKPQNELLALEGVLQNLKLNWLPHSLCPDCHGKNTESCTTCRHTGFIGKLAWDVQTPEETKAQILKAIKK